MPFVTLHCLRIVAQKLFQCICFVWTIRMCVCVCYENAPLLLMVAIRSHRDTPKSFQQTFFNLAHFFPYLGMAVVRMKIRLNRISCSSSWIFFSGRNSRLANKIFRCPHAYRLMFSQQRAIRPHKWRWNIPKLCNIPLTHRRTHTLVFIALCNIWSWYCLLDNATLTSRKLSTETIIAIHISKVGIPAFTYLKIHNIRLGMAHKYHFDANRLVFWFAERNRLSTHVVDACKLILLHGI